MCGDMVIAASRVLVVNGTDRITWSRKMTKRHYNNGDGEFVLEPLSDSLVKVTHRDQTGYFGIKRTGTSTARMHAPYWSSRRTSMASPTPIWGYTTPERALESLCTMILTDQRKKNSKRINSEGRSRPGRR